MGIAKGFRDLLDQLDGTCRADGAVRDQILERARVHVAHDQEGIPVCLAEVMHREDVAVFQLGNRACFLLEALKKRAVFQGHLLRQHLDRHIAIHAGLVSTIDRGHAAHANLIQNLVWTKRTANQGMHRPLFPTSGYARRMYKSGVICIVHQGSPCRLTRCRRTT